MKNLIDYKIKNGKTNLRRENRRNFVDNIQGEKNNKFTILTIHFNNRENIRTLLSYIEKETNQNIDIVIIENSTKKEELKILKKYCEGKKNITIITPMQNIGSAGGYALGMEYIIHKEYEYCFIVEDDVIFIGKDVFSDMTKYANNETLTFIHNCKNTRSSSHSDSKGKSWRVQIAGYPVNFIEKIGIIDPRYFFRGEDLERGKRIEMGLKKLTYKIHIISKDYLHPYLKSVNGNYARFYFSIRNQLLSLQKHFIDNIFLFVTIFMYLRTAIIKFLLEKNIILLRSCYCAIRDFFKQDYSFGNNIKNISIFINNINPQIKGDRVDNLMLKKYTQQLYSNARILTLSGIDRENLFFSSSILDIFKHGILISSSSTVFTPLFLLAPKVVCINEVNLGDDRIHITTYFSKMIFIKFIFIIISLFASLGIIIILFPIITLFIICHIKWRIKK